MKTGPVFRVCLILLAALATASGVAAQQPVPDKDYKLITPPQKPETDKKVQVIEFFSYACPHCAEFEPALQTWLKRKPKDVDYRMVPMVFRDAWKAPAKLYYALEALSQARLSRGLIRDDITARLVATRTPVAVADDSEFPPDCRAFLRRNYLPFGDLRVAGVTLADADSLGGRRFEIRVPQEYAVVSARGPAAGWLDGTLYRGARRLEPGPHSYRGPRSEGRMAVVWAPAVQRVGWPVRRRSPIRPAPGGQRGPFGAYF